MNEYQRARRFEDRTRWAALCWVDEFTKLVAYKDVNDRAKEVVRETHAALTRMRIAK